VNLILLSKIKQATVDNSKPTSRRNLDIKKLKY